MDLSQNQTVASGKQAQLISGFIIMITIILPLKLIYRLIARLLFLAPIINSSWAPKLGPNMNRQQLVFYKYSSGNSMTHWSADELLVSPGKICSRYLNILRGQSLERESWMFLEKCCPTMTITASLCHTEHYTQQLSVLITWYYFWLPHKKAGLQSRARNAQR